MTRKWYEPDPEPDCNGETGYTRVTYRKPITEEERKLRAARRKREEEDLDFIMADPMRKYRHEREQEIRRKVARFSKDPKYYQWSQAQLYAYVRGFMGNEGEPVVWKKAKSEEEIQKEKLKRREQRRATRRRERELERRAEEGDFSVKEFDSEFIARVIKTRNDREMTQKDLAKTVNRPEGVIRDLEAGKLPFDGGLKSLLIWKLGWN